MTGYELLAVLLPGGALYRIYARKIEGRDQTQPPILCTTNMRFSDVCGAFSAI